SAEGGREREIGVPSSSVPQRRRHRRPRPPATVRCLSLFLSPRPSFFVQSHCDLDRGPPAIVLCSFPHCNKNPRCLPPALP
ncbi:hypothetical protein ZEAMMB73_Zm00001d016059, partial [Zea mays]